jgi:hypothetical protein
MLAEAGGGLVRIFEHSERGGFVQRSERFDACVHVVKNLDPLVLGFHLEQFRHLGAKFR